MPQGFVKKCLRILLFESRSIRDDAIRVHVHGLATMNIVDMILDAHHVTFKNRHNFSVNPYILGVAEDCDAASSPRGAFITLLIPCCRRWAGLVRVNLRTAILRRPLRGHREEKWHEDKYAWKERRKQNSSGRSVGVAASRLPCTGLVYLLFNAKIHRPHLYTGNQIVRFIKHSCNLHAVCCKPVSTSVLLQCCLTRKWDANSRVSGVKYQSAFHGTK